MTFTRPAARTINLVKDPTGAPAVNLSKVREAGHIDLVKRAEKAGISLSKRNLSGLRGAVRLWPEVIVDQSNYVGIVESTIWHPRKMRGTRYVPRA